jgi:hypothetical protein
MTTTTDLKPDLCRKTYGVGLRQRSLPVENILKDPIADELRVAASGVGTFDAVSAAPEPAPDQKSVFPLHDVLGVRGSRALHEGPG